VAVHQMQMLILLSQVILAPSKASEMGCWMAMTMMTQTRGSGSHYMLSGSGQ